MKSSILDDNLFLSDYTWEVDQKISSRAIMKSGLCSLPPENKLWKEINIEPTKEQILKRVNASSMLHLFQKMTTMLDAEKSFNITEEAHFHLTDVGQYFILKVCR